MSPLKGQKKGTLCPPELFKLYVPKMLDDIKELNVPLHNGFKISHIPWPDDCFWPSMQTVF
jgi:hypothetical protein